VWGWAEVERRKPEDLVAEAARLHGLLWLRWDETVSRIAAVLPDDAGRVVLDEATHAAYQQLVDRILGICTPATRSPRSCTGRGDRGSTVSGTRGTGGGAMARASKAAKATPVGRVAAPERATWEETH
jgi:hypothetical protein